MLIGKGIAEALFLTALATWFTYANFHPFFRGALDVADAQRVEGWAVDSADPSARVQVHLYIDGRFAEARAADEERADVLQAGRARDARHGFRFKTPPLAPGREYEARVYAVHEARDRKSRTLQLLGKPLRFSIKPAG